jgi:hypothetical protein
MAFQFTADMIKFISQISIDPAKFVEWMTETLHFGPKYSPSLLQQLNCSFCIACFDCAGSGIRCK